MNLRVAQHSISVFTPTANILKNQGPYANDKEFLRVSFLSQFGYGTEVNIWRNERQDVTNT